MRFWHIKDKPRFHTYRQEKEVPPLTNRHLKLSIISVDSLREKCIRELIFLLIVLKTYTFLFLQSLRTEQLFWKAADPG